MQSLTAITLHNIASEINATEIALRLALNQCNDLRDEIKQLKAEREAYFTPRVEGNVTVNLSKNDATQTISFKAQIGNAEITSSIDQDVFLRNKHADIIYYVVDNAAYRLAHLISKKIAPLLIEAMKENNIS